MRSFLIFLFTACSFALYGEARAAESLVAFDESQVTPQTVSPDTSERVTGKPQSSYARNLSGVSPDTSLEFPSVPLGGLLLELLGGLSYDPMPSHGVGRVGREAIQIKGGQVGALCAEP